MGCPPNRLTAPSVDIRVLVLRLLKIIATVRPCKTDCVSAPNVPFLTALLYFRASLTRHLSSFGDRSDMLSRCLVLVCVDWRRREIVSKRDLGGKMDLKAVLEAIRNIVVSLLRTLRYNIENEGYLQIRYDARLIA